MPFDAQNRLSAARGIQMSSVTETQQRRALSIRETARACGLSRATLYRQIKDGKLATIKIGSRRLVPVASIDALLNGGAQ
jgi:excisionase family DNA binding protein